MLIFILLYLLGLGALLATFLPFSPLTIDLVNLSREVQLAIYLRRHALWSLTATSWTLALAVGFTGRAAPALEPTGAAGVLGVSVLLFMFMFWTGYVPVVMTPPGNTRRLSGETAAAQVSAEDIVLGIALDGESCAYLRDQIARPHYLIDQLGTRRLVVSYCILCNSATAFEAMLRGKPMDLRCVTAYNNNIIYRDRASGNFIQQLDGRVILGPDKGALLEMVPVTVMRWQDWLAQHPDTALLDAPALAWRDRLVGAMLELLIPIRRLARRTRPWHRVRGELDSRLGPMHFVLGVERAGEAVAYELGSVSRRGVIDDELGGLPIAVFGSPDGEVANVFERRHQQRELNFEAHPSGRDDGIVARDRETGSLWDVAGHAVRGPLAGDQLNPVPHFNKLFWFSWALFKPHVRLYVDPADARPTAYLNLDRKPS